MQHYDHSLQALPYLKWEHLLVDPVKDDHGSGPGQKARHVTTHLAGGGKGVVLHVLVGCKKLNHLLVDGVLGEGHEALKESLLAQQLQEWEGQGALWYCNEHAKTTVSNYYKFTHTHLYNTLYLELVARPLFDVH